MYNRYVPQSDGSYSRRRMAPSHPKSDTASCSPPATDGKNCDPPSKPINCPAREETGAGNFLRNLLPKDFDTGDLLIVLLLLLMAGDCQEDRNWAWLTLALYLFL